MNKQAMESCFQRVLRHHLASAARSGTCVAACILRLSAIQLSPPWQRPATPPPAWQARKVHRLLLIAPCACSAGHSSALPMICPTFCDGAALASANAIVAGPNNRQMENAVDQQHSFNAALERPGSDHATSMQAMTRPVMDGAALDAAPRFMNDARRPAHG